VPDEEPLAVPPTSKVIAVAGVLVGTLGAVAHCVYLALPVIDDAAITIAYGLSLFEGSGLRVTPLSAPVEGFSNPLWMLLTGLAGPLHLNPLAFCQWLGIALGALALVAFAAWGPAAEGRAPRWDDAVVPLCVAAIPNYQFWVASGMETGLFALLLGLSGAFFLKELRTGTGTITGVMLGLLLLTRPETPLYVAAAGLLWILVRLSERRAPGLQLVKIALWTLLLGGGYVLFRRFYFASWWPNTYYAKRLFDFGARQYFGGFLQIHSALCISAGGGALLALFGAPALRRRALLSSAFVLCGLAFIWHSTGDWMPEWRFVAPLVPCAAAAVAAGVSAAQELLARVRSKPIARLAPVLTLLLLLGLGRTHLLRAPAVKAAPGFPASFVAQQSTALLEFLKSKGARRPRLGMPDIGGLGLNARNADVVDLAGLADYAIGHHVGNLPATEDYLVSEGAPEVIDAHGPSGHIGDFRTLMVSYQRFGNVFVASGLINQDDPRCPGGRQRVEQLSTQAWMSEMDADLRNQQALEAIALWRCARLYWPDEKLPAPSWVASRAELADQTATKLIAEDNRMLALRHLSLAAILEQGNAHRRRKTEALRMTLFPPPPLNPG
jgi:hypothetical protein